MPAMSEDATAAENASSQMVAAVEAAGASNEAQKALSSSPEEKAAAVRLGIYLLEHVICILFATLVRQF